MSTIKFDYAEAKLAELLLNLSRRAFTPIEFWRQTSRIVTGATGLDSAEDLQAELTKSQDQFAVMTDAANRLMTNLKWMVGNATCPCEGIHTCGLDEQLKQIDRIERQMQHAQGVAIPNVMH